MLPRTRPQAASSSAIATGGLTIGYTGDPFQGVQDTGAAADAISLTNAGTIDINFGGGEVVRGPVNVTVTATGATADILTGGDNGFAATAASYPRAALVTFNAGQDILVGDTLTSNFGDIGRCSAGSAVMAGRDVILNQASNIYISGRGTAAVTVTHRRGQHFAC